MTYIMCDLLLLLLLLVLVLILSNSDDSMGVVACYSYHWSCRNGQGGNFSPFLSNVSLLFPCSVVRGRRLMVGSSYLQYFFIMEQIIFQRRYRSNQWWTIVVFRCRSLNIVGIAVKKNHGTIVPVVRMVVVYVL